MPADDGTEGSGCRRGGGCDGVALPRHSVLVSAAAVPPVLRGLVVDLRPFFCVRLTLFLSFSSLLRSFFFLPVRQCVRVSIRLFKWDAMRSYTLTVCLFWPHFSLRQKLISLNFSLLSSAASAERSDWPRQIFRKNRQSSILADLYSQIKIKLRCYYCYQMHSLYHKILIY